MKIIRIIPIFLGFFILCGCSADEMAHSVGQNQTHSAFGNNPLTNVAENNQKPNLNINSQVPVFVERDIKPVTIKEAKICETYLLKKIFKEKAKDSQIAKLENFDTTDEMLPLEFKKWIEFRSRKNLVAFKLQQGDKKALIFGSYNFGATGLAINFQNWYVQFDIHVVKFISLSQNPKLIFWDKDGLLNYYSVEFSGEFAVNKDWNNVTLNLLRYKVNSNGESQLLSEERNVRCR